MQEIYKKYHTTTPNSFSSIYFNYLYKQIINQLNFNKKLIILDFGCSLGLIKKKL